MSDGVAFVALAAVAIVVGLLLVTGVVAIVVLIFLFWKTLYDLFVDAGDGRHA